MLFNTGVFWVFFAAVLLTFSLAPKRARSAVLLVASYLFYAFWDWRFLSLIAVSTIVDYVAGRNLPTSPRKRVWLYTSVCTNLGILGFFKYFNFFAESAVALGQLLGLELGPTTLRIILPVGISEVDPIVRTTRGLG